ncbi:MAG: diguanylate cyclase [Spirochaetaceae bacterium]|nr:diguanylate cyclase [Spirochaetaceae bacterium]
MKRIFVVDDSSLALAALSKLLGAEGYETSLRQHPMGAAEAIAEAAPDLVLLDVVMPGMSGIELLRALKASPATTDIPVIMVTALTDAQLVHEALESGAFDYIRKPYEAIEVAARVRSALRIREYQDRLKELSQRDSLTGLLNHGTFIATLQRELEAAAAAGKPLSVAMIDLDHFKTVNDTYGHAAGDLVLAGISALLRDSVGQSGIAGRYGGEEFCVLLRGFGLAMAKRHAEAFRALVEERSWDVGSAVVKITLSSGIAEAEASSNAGALIAAADKALYTAKKQGRNRVEARGF